MMDQEREQDYNRLRDMEQRLNEMVLKYQTVGTPGLVTIWTLKEVMAGGSKQDVD